MTAVRTILLAAALLVLGCPDPPVPPEGDLDGDEWPDVTDTCVDVDGDDYGRADYDTSGCLESEPDCDDNDVEINPGATEACDAADNDCDGDVDEGFDADGDGYTMCGEDGVQPSPDDDCDDTDADRNPGVAEECNGIDDSCNGEIPADEVDDDGDGVMVCEDDCDDGDDTVYPGADELCDGLDNDCDGSVPDDDHDGDGDG